MIKIKTKRIFFFDIDNTLFSTKYKKIWPQTIKTIKILSQDPNVILSIATGRNKTRLNVLGNLLPFFKHLVLLNGSVVIINDKIINEKFFSKEEVLYLTKEANSASLHTGMVGLYQEAVLYKKDLLFITEKLKDFFSMKMNILDDKFYLSNNVYQMWIIDKNINKINNFINNYKQFQFFYWNDGGVDVVLKGINKFYGIKQIQKIYPEYQLICVGDGYNDIDMIKYAHIGIAMDNTKYNQIKEISNIIAPHIDEDKMYDFFKINNLIKI
ncbi:HAD family hydrolase [Candidatus Phytoplasma prunorum]|uniref:HAD family hydrolase n=1 Tax=Candidatus Phytoplasma prunorum TaxID=47565 RepID=UPI002FF11598